MKPNPFCLRHDVNVSHGICEYSIKWNDVTLKHTGYTECIIFDCILIYVYLFIESVWTWVQCTIRSVKFHFIHKRNKMFYFSYIMIHGYPFLLFCLLKLFNWKHDANLMINNTIKTNLSWISITYLQSDINSMKRVNIYIKHHNQTDHQNIIHVWLYSIYIYVIKIGWVMLLHFPVQMTHLARRCVGVSSIEPS